MKPATKDARPVHLDLATFKFPFAAITSILHRISGVVLFIAMPFLLYALQISLSGNEGFVELQNLFGQVFYKLLLFILIAALVYHFCAGVKHLIMDIGYLETLKSSRIAAVSLLVISLVLTLAVAGALL